MFPPVPCLHFPLLLGEFVIQVYLQTWHRLRRRPCEVEPFHLTACEPKRVTSIVCCLELSTTTWMTPNHYEKWGSAPNFHPFNTCCGSKWLSFGWFPNFPQQHPNYISLTYQTMYLELYSVISYIPIPPQNPQAYSYHDLTWTLPPPHRAADVSRQQFFLLGSRFEPRLLHIPMKGLAIFGWMEITLDTLEKKSRGSSYRSTWVKSCNENMTWNPPSCKL